MARWNVMIYLAGDNNLSEEMIWALKEMQTANIGNNVVSVQFDPRGSKIPVCRFVIGSGSKPLCNLTKNIPMSPLADDIKEFRRALRKKHIRPQERLELENTGNPLTLLYFIWWAMKDRLTAEWRHMLVLSGHGSGSEGDFMMDDTTRDSLTIQQFSKTLADAKKLFKRKIDILGLDSCLMSTAEVYYQVRHCVDHLVAAEGFEPNSGWPYGALLSKLPANPEYVASKIVKNYTYFYFEYANGGLSVDLSACKVGLWKQLKKAVARLSRVLTTAIDDEFFANAIILAHWRAQSYKSDQYVDLVDFAEVLKTEVAKINTNAGKGDAKAPINRSQLKAKIEHACGVLRQVMTGNARPAERIVLKSAYVGPAFQYSFGLSVYFPWSHVSPYYRDLDFANHAEWYTFLAKYVQATDRNARPGYPPADNKHLMEIMAPPRLPAMRRGVVLTTRPSQKATDPGNRATDPGNRATDPGNRGKIVFTSMKNPPRDWLGCDLLKKSDSPFRGLFGDKKVN